jgi:8-oxo-dGTP pyrophosphatase MutT (NUDIX family)
MRSDSRRRALGWRRDQRSGQRSHSRCGVRVGGMDLPAEIRRAVRVLLVDEDDRVLLFCARNPEADVVFWFPPGGGIEPGEDVQDAARRELEEELGRRDVQLDAEVWHRRHIFTWREVRYDQRERWFLAHVGHFEPDMAGVTETEKTDLAGWRWWTLSQLETTTDQLTPRQLAAHLSDLLRDGPPLQPIRVGV